MFRIILPYDAKEELGLIANRLINEGYTVRCDRIIRMPSGTKSTVIEYRREKMDDLRWEETLPSREDEA